MDPKDLHPKEEPLWWAYVAKLAASGIVALAAHYGLSLDAAGVTATVLGAYPLVDALATWVARKHVFKASTVETAVGSARAEGISIGQAGPQ